jgi:hypothetical protein
MFLFGNLVFILLDIYKDPSWGNLVERTLRNLSEPYAAAALQTTKCHGAQRSEIATHCRKGAELMEPIAPHSN